MVSDELLLGVDVGTTNCKVGLYSLCGKELAWHSAPTPVHTPRPGWWEHPPEAVWQAVVGLVRKALDGIEPARVKGIAATGMGEAGVPLDASGEALYPAISWRDQRTQYLRERFDKRVSASALFARTGLQTSHIYSLHKLAWLLDDAGGRCRRLHRWVDLPGYVAYRLCGELAMDHSQASRTMAFDLWARGWSDELCATHGVPLNVFPPIAQAGTRLGTVSSLASGRTGLAVGTVVGVGGHDHICAALGAGVVAGDVWLNSVGTTEVLLMAGSEACMRRVADEYREALLGCHVVPGCNYALLALPAAGTFVDWCVRLSGDRHGAAIAQAGLVERGSAGLLAFPQSMEGGGHGFAGLTEEHGHPHLLRAVLEGLAFELHRQTMGVPQGLQRNVNEVRAVGGGAQNRLWLELKAAVLGLPVVLPVVREAGCFGAALLAGMACGLFSSADEAWRTAYRAADTVFPEPDAVAFYRQLFTQTYAPLRRRWDDARRARPV